VGSVAQDQRFFAWQLLRLLGEAAPAELGVCIGAYLEAGNQTGEQQGMDVQLLLQMLGEAAPAELGVCNGGWV